MNPDRHILDDLAQLGRSRDERIPDSLLDKDLAWRNLVCGNEPWRQAAAERTSEQIAELIRGLVLYSKASGRATGGSVSPVIALYRVLIDRKPSWEPELTRWIVLNRTNPYEPFGTINDEGATTHSEYVERRAIRALRARANQAAEVERQEGARKVRANRATSRIVAAVRRGDLLAVKALLEEGANLHQALPEGESLLVLAEQNGRDSVAELLRSLGIT